MKTLLISITFILFLTKVSAQALASGDAILLAKLVGNTAAQLKELKEILEVNNATLEQVEKANRKVQQTRYRILRAKYIVDSAVTLQNSNVHSIDDGIGYLRKGKGIGKNGINFAQEFKDLSPKEKERVIQELDEADDEATTLQEKINLSKVSIAENKVKQRQGEERKIEIQKYHNLTEFNEETAASGLDPNTAQVETAKNTSLTNSILVQQSTTQADTLDEIRKLNNKQDQEKLEALKQEEANKKHWGKRY